MADREKVIKGIQECDLNGGRAGNCPYKDILFLLKEQEPVKPKSKARHGENAQYQHFCGNCMAMLFGKPKFCPNCGRVVMWK